MHDTIRNQIMSDCPSDPNVPPIIILHDLLGTKRHWESMGKTLYNVMKRSVIIVDLRNHGDSPHVNSHKYKDVALDVLHLYKKLAIRRATLVGHSVGGRTCMCAALMAPEKVASILVVDMSPVSNADEFLKLYPRLMKAMKTVNFRGTKQVSHGCREARCQLKHIVPDVQTRELVLSNVKVKKDGTIGWACNLDILIKHFEYMSEIPHYYLRKQYPGPALFIGGQVSEYMPADDLPSIRSLFPQAIVSYVRGAGHHVHVDEPKAFLEYAIPFIRSYT